MTAREILWLLRAVSTLPAVGLIGLFLGPVTPAIERLGLSDGQAHILAFFCVTSAVLMLWPKTSRWGLALAVFAASGLIEIAQASTGRGPEFMDLAANAVGIAMSLGALALVKGALRASTLAIRRLGRREPIPARSTITPHLFRSALKP